MQIVPIVGRELLVAARHPRTWWQRVLALLVALGFVFFVWLEVGNRAPPNIFGRHLFNVLGFLSLLYAVLAGPLLTVDCLAKERREGTLGLLFLTDLSSYDVVLGKMFAAVIDMVLGVMAILPLAAIPMLLGGVGLRDYAYLVLGVFNLLFLSAAVGTLASATFASVRASLGFAVIFLLGITAGIPGLLGGLWGLTPGSTPADYFYMFCPAYTFALCLNGGFFGSVGFWLNMVGINALGWVCLLLACWSTWQSWRESPETDFSHRWWRFLARISSQSRPARRSRREQLLGKNPVQWLESRDPLQGRLLWSVFLTTTFFWFYKHLQDPGGWPNDEVLIFWALLAHWAFCGWLAIQAPRRMADDKQSGALELLLCTAITPREIVRGSMRVLTRRFGSVLAGMFLLNVFAFYVFVVLSGARSLSSLMSQDIFELALGGAVVIPVQGYAFAYVGLYQGLIRGNSLRATWHLVLKLGVLPWLLFFLCLFGLETYRRYIGLGWFGNERYIFALWTLIHVGVCGFFVSGADHRLRRHFRSLAAEPAPPSLLKRASRAAQLLLKASA